MIRARTPFSLLRPSLFLLWKALWQLPIPPAACLRGAPHHHPHSSQPESWHTSPAWPWLVSPQVGRVPGAHFTPAPLPPGVTCLLLFLLARSCLLPALRPHPSQGPPALPDKQALCLRICVSGLPRANPKENGAHRRVAAKALGNPADPHDPKPLLPPKVT